MSLFIRSIVSRAKADKKTIVLPEGNDPRTLEAAEHALRDGIANLIILGNEEEIRSSGYAIDEARIIDPATYEKREELAEQLYELRKRKGMTIEKAHETINDVLYFGVMLVKTGMVDGMVAGACHSSADVLRPSLQILKTAPGVSIVSAFFMVCVPDTTFGDHGTFLFSDCGLVVHPDSEELATIAATSAETFKRLVGSEPRVAMLSHSTYGSAHNDDSLKVISATALAKKKAPHLCIDGEMQLDAAIVPEIGEAKAPGSPVAGRANVLIFPDLDAGNIGYKLVQRLAKAEAYGPITQGIAAPVNDLSRGCGAHDIYGVIAITAVQAQQQQAAEEQAAE